MQVEFLLRSGADANCADKSGRTPLHYARLGVIAAQLIEAGGAFADHTDNAGNTPLHCVSIRAASIAPDPIPWLCNLRALTWEGSCALGLWQDPSRCVRSPTMHVRGYHVSKHVTVCELSHARGVAVCVCMLLTNHVHVHSNRRRRR